MIYPAEPIVLKLVVMSFIRFMKERDQESFTQQREITLRGDRKSTSPGHKRFFSITFGMHLISPL